MDMDPLDNDKTGPCIDLRRDGGLMDTEPLDNDQTDPCIGLSRDKVHEVFRRVAVPAVTTKPTQCKKCFKQFKGLESILRKLHLQLTRNAILEGNTDMQSIWDKVSIWTDPDVSRRITCSLNRHFKATNATITRFRASIIHSLTDEWTWPIVEWTEIDGSEVVAIFFIDEDAPSDVCGWLMHTGRGLIENPEDGASRWEKTSIDWNVGEMEDLHSLFEAAEQLWGILQWPTQDMLRLYCGTGDAETWSNEEYLSCPI